MFSIVYLKSKIQHIFAWSSDQKQSKITICELKKKKSALTHIAIFVLWMEHSPMEQMGALWKSIQWDINQTLIANEKLPTVATCAEKDP